MALTRREVLAAAAAGTALACAGPRATAAPSDRAALAPAAPKKILILGGTGFLGPALVKAAKDRGHQVTIFNRGKTRPHLFEKDGDVEKLHGDRDGQLAALEGRRWHGVVDTSGYVPRIVRLSAELLAPNVEQYVFISTISVYARSDVVGMDETGALEPLADPTSEDPKGNEFKNYGALKALAEQAAEAAMPGRVTNLRPGLIVGPEDPSDRFTYWPVRLARGGEVLGPGDGSDPVQLIDVRDLAEWTIRCLEAKHVGVMNALGPARRFTARELIDACQRAAGGDAKVTWVDPAFLEAQAVMPWRDLPAWIPARGDSAGAGTMSNARAVARGLTFRPAEDTARSTLEWWSTLPEERRAKLRAGLTPEREREVLAAWHARG